MENPYLTSIAREGGKHAWIGKLPPFEFDIIDMESCTNFRVDAHFHHSYDVVWLFEKPLETYSLLSWKIIVDESVRLLKREGTLIINFHPTQDFTVPLVKHFLGRHINLDVAVAYEKDNIFVFHIKRLHFEKYIDDSWTFAILTTGNKDKEVIAFLDSIRRNDKDNKHEIIISGPQKNSYDAYHVRYLDMSQFRDDEYMEISKKKNAIAASATHANLLIVHDRYYLGDNFFEGFDRFGYDFDFVAVNQKFENGETFPFYTALYPPFLSWTHPVNFTNYNVLSSSQYVNGGAIAIKTHTLQKLHFNSLLMWSQMEDVEITGFLMHHSIIPRVNTISTLYTYDYQKGRTNSFKLFDQYDGNHVIHKVETAYRSQYADFVNKNNDTALLTQNTIINNNNDTLLYINKPFRLHISKKKKFPFIRISFSGKQLKTYLAMWLGQRGLINIDYPLKLHVTLHKHFPFVRISGSFDTFGKRRILYDITTLGSGFASPQNRTGVYRVSEEALSALINDNRLITYVYSSQNNKDDCIAYLKHYYPELINNFVKSKYNNKLQQLINIFNPKYRVCMSPYFEIPQKFRHILLCKKVYIIYDLIQVKFPQFVNKIDTVKYSHFLKKINTSDRILCISKYTMNDFKKEKPNVKDISVIPLGVSSHFKKDISPDLISKIIRKYCLPQKYFFSISSLNPRKNFAHVVKSFIIFIEQYQRHDVSLLIAEPEGWGDLFDGIDMKKYEDQIRFTGFIPDEELPVLYRNAVASVYMSLYEGFGLPLLESIACGTPVIASNTSSIPEVIGDAGILLDPHDQNGLAEAYYRILTEKGLRERLLQNADEILKKYTWENFANVLRDKIL